MAEDDQVSGFWKEFFRQQFHYSKLSTFHEDWRAFVYSPWLPHRWTYQLIYLIYRWFIALYYTGWFIYGTTVAIELHGPKFLIFVTHWSMIVLVLYLLTFAISVTIHYIWKNFIKKVDAKPLTLTDLKDPPIRCCSCSGNTRCNFIPFQFQFAWVLFTISSELAIPVVVLYWSFFDGNVYSWPANLHEHLLNVLPGLIDLFVTRIPIRLYHFLHLMMFAFIYVAFGGVYIASGGTNSNNESYIYPIVNYSDNLPVAIVVNSVMVFVVPVLLHLVYWGLYLLRTLLLYVKISIGTSNKSTQSVSDTDVLATESSQV
jgi:hypothetical protein